MKILIVNTSERTGGAAVAANRLVKALQRSKIAVKMLVRDKQTDNPTVVSVNTNGITRKINQLRFYWERACVFFFNHFNRKNLFSISIANTGTDISQHPLVREADIIHLHWINQGFLSLADIKKLIGLRKPIVWTMHDMWPCTGICHHARECLKYQTACEECFFLSSKGKDVSTSTFAEKKRIYTNANITFVGCSEWLLGRARQSTLLRDKTVVSIPNPIDTNVFHPIDTMQARHSLGLPLQKKLLLFGALNVTDKRKGVDYLIEALKRVERIDLELVVFGQVKEDIKDLLPVPIHSMGYLNDETKIALLYNAVDLFVTSSLEENLPNTIMESMACGTPCVGFHIGGIPEMIDHQVNGYVAEYKNYDDLAVGIQWVLTNKDTAALSDACVKKVQENYTEQVVAEKYIALYDKILKKQNACDTAFVRQANK